MAKHVTYLLTAFICGALLFAGCSDPQRKVAGNYTYKTECMGVEMDGSVTLKAWGNGRYGKDARDQALKNAVADVLFSGISEGRQDCNPRPVLGEVNIRQRHEDYFNQFFADGGDFRKFVNFKDERYESKRFRERTGARESLTLGVIVRVKRQALIERMKEDGILR